MVDFEYSRMNESMMLLRNNLNNTWQIRSGIPFCKEKRSYFQKRDHNSKYLKKKSISQMDIILVMYVFVMLRDHHHNNRTLSLLQVCLSTKIDLFVNLCNINQTATLS